MNQDGLSFSSFILHPSSFILRVGPIPAADQAMNGNMAETKQRTRCPAWLVGLLLGGAVLALYARGCGLGFINFDDDDYVTRNAHVQQGLTVDGLCWAITSLDEVNWHPLPWLSLQLDSQVFGTTP